jgi:transcriptional regulator with XRE-family HTH domain
MQINSNAIKTEREKRAWSQEQLALVAGVGLRTIQRVESTGIASNETAKSLAAVFECSLEDLRVPAPQQTAQFWKRPVFVSIAVISAILSIGLATVRVQAKEVMLNVVLKSTGGEPSTFMMLTEEGKQAEAKIDNQFRLVLLPTLQEHDRILIAAEIYEYDGAAFKLISRPKVLTANGKEAVIQVGSNSGKIYDIKVMPQRMK